MESCECGSGLWANYKCADCDQRWCEDCVPVGSESAPGGYDDLRCPECVAEAKIAVWDWEAVAWSCHYDLA